jgi:hypothetical protein
VKALTICQPYAHLIATGEKVVENRTWPTSHRGTVAIHAGRSLEWLDPNDKSRYPGMAFGAVVAVARLAACVRVENLTAAPWAGHEHAFGPWCWCLADVRVLREPVDCRGAQGLWTLEAADAARVLEVLATGRS